MRLLSLVSLWACAPNPSAPEAVGQGPGTDAPMPPTPAELTEPPEPGACDTLPPQVLAIETATSNDAATLGDTGAFAGAVFGVQGGWHVWIGGTVRSPGESVAVTAEMMDLDTGTNLTEAGASPVYLGLVDWSADDCAGVIPPLAVRMIAPEGEDQADQACAREGHTLQVTLFVTDLTTGAVAEPLTFTFESGIDPEFGAICPG